MKKILIVEDQPDIRRLIRMTLEFEEWEIDEAPDAMAGWELARGSSADREAGLAAGATQYLVKPFSPMQLLTLLGDTVAKP